MPHCPVLLKQQSFSSPSKPQGDPITAQTSESKDLLSLCKVSWLGKQDF